MVTITMLEHHLSLHKFIRLWNQGLVNLGFDDNKTRFRTNDYISSVIRQDDFQNDNHKNKSSQREIIKKKKTSKRSVFQDSSFIRSLCKVVGVLEFSCITLFTYAPKSSKSYFVLNILKLNDFMFSTKTLCQMFSKLPLKVLSWKSWLLSQKRLNRLNRMRNWSTLSSTGQRVQKNIFLSSRTIVQLVKVEPQLIDSPLNWLRSDQGAIKVQQSPAKH